MFTHLTEDGGEGDRAIAWFRRSVPFPKIWGWSVPFPRKRFTAQVQWSLHDESYCRANSAISFINQEGTPLGHVILWDKVAWYNIRHGNSDIFHLVEWRLGPQLGEFVGLPLVNTETNGRSNTYVSCAHGFLYLCKPCKHAVWCACSKFSWLQNGCYFYAKINDWDINCQMLTLLFALTGLMELPYILILLCNNRNQIYANIMHTLVEKYTLLY